MNMNNNMNQMPMMNNMGMGMQMDPMNQRMVVNPNLGVKQTGDWNWKKKTLSVNENNTMTCYNNTYNITWVNNYCFWNFEKGSVRWYYIFNAMDGSYHCFRYTGSGGCFEEMKPTMANLTLGTFKFQNLMANVSKEKIVFGSSSEYKITWLNDLTFYHKESGCDDYWYYIYNPSKGLYHCAKKIRNQETYNMKRFQNVRSTVNMIQPQVQPMMMNQNQMMSNVSNQPMIMGGMMGNRNIGTKQVGEFNWKKNRLVIKNNNEMLSYGKTYQINWVNNYSFWHVQTGTVRWYYIYDPWQNFYHCCRYTGSGGSQVEMKPTMANGTLGTFQFNNLSAQVSKEKIVFGMKSEYKIQWLNDLTFRHKESGCDDYWYYIYDPSKTSYHCIKKHRGQETYEMKRWNVRIPTVNPMQQNIQMPLQQPTMMMQQPQMLQQPMIQPMMQQQIVKQTTTTQSVFRGNNPYTSIPKPVGSFNWGGQELIVLGDKMIWGGTEYSTTWVNNLTFYHKEGSGYWYYIYDTFANEYHCIKYTSGGFKKMKRNL